MELFVLVLGIGYIVIGLLYRVEVIGIFEPTWYRATPNSLFVPWWRAGRFGQPGDVTDPRLWVAVTRRVSLVVIAFGFVVLAILFTLHFDRAPDLSERATFGLAMILVIAGQAIIWWYTDRTARQVLKQFERPEM